MNKSDVITHFGTLQSVAEALGITHGAVWQWPDDLPTDRQAQIEILTGGALKADMPLRGKYKRPAKKAIRQSA